MLALIAAGAGVLLAYWGLGLAKEALPCCIPRAEEIAIDLRVLAVALAVAVSAGVGFAVVPAWLARRASPAMLLSHRSPTTTPGYRRWRAAFLTAEVSLAAALLVVSTLFVGSFVRVVWADLGFDRSDLAGFDLAYYDGNRTPILDALRATPGVEAVAAYSGPLPLITEAFGGARSFLTLRAGDFDSPLTTQASLYVVPPEYFATAGLDIVRGRGFTAADTSMPVAIIDELFVQALFNGREPIGARLFRGEVNPTLEIIGVVESAVASGPGLGAGTQVYLPLSPESTTASQFLVRSSGRSADVIPVIQASLDRVLPTHVPKPTIHPLDEAFARITAGRRSNAKLMSAFGLVVLLVGAGGVYGVMASTVAQQRRELGVRIALGATRAQIVRGVLARAGRFVVVGLVVGLALGRAVSELAAALLFEVTPTDLLVYLIVAGLLALAGLAAALPPAWRAACVDPIATLRSE